MPYTMADFERWYIKEQFANLTPQEQREALQKLPPEKRQVVLQEMPVQERLAGLSPEQIKEYLDQLTAGTAPRRRKPPKKN